MIQFKKSVFIFGLSFIYCSAKLKDAHTQGLFKVAHPKKTSEEIIKALEKHEIIPDVIQRVSTEVQVCEVAYNDTVVNFGNVINYTIIQEHEPTHIKWPTKEGKMYTLLLSSPDAPSRKEHNERELQLWLVGNIPGNDIDRGTPLSEYVGMVPFYEEGLHRYVFLVFEQESSEKIDFDEVYLPKKDNTLMRAYFHTEAFIHDEEEYKYGPLIAANFFLMTYKIPASSSTTSTIKPEVPIEY